MTSFSVVAGNMPLALALDPGSASRSSLGIVVIGGVLSSLVLTLLLIPNVYMWVAPKDHPSPNGAAHPRPEQLTLNGAGTPSPARQLLGESSARAPGRARVRRLGRERGSR